MTSVHIESKQKHMMQGIHNTKQHAAVHTCTPVQVRVTRTSISESWSRMQQQLPCNLHQGHWQGPQLYMHVPCASYCWIPLQHNYADAGAQFPWPLATCTCSVFSPLASINDPLALVVIFLVALAHILNALIATCTEYYTCNYMINNINTHEPFLWIASTPTTQILWVGLC